MSKKIEERPEFVIEEHLTFLDALRESGVTNMFGARPYIQEEFHYLSKGEASAVLMYWMHTFEDRQRSV